MLPGHDPSELDVVIDAAAEWRREREEAGLPLESSEVVWFAERDGGGWFW
jgi:hypothetical protein